MSGNDAIDSIDFVDPMAGAGALLREAEQTRWQRLEALFHAASALPSAERAPYLRQQCGEDVELFTDVLDLLASDSSVSDKMSTPVLAEDGRYLVRRPDEDAWTGRTLSGFTLEDLLGRGGMGAVYRGTRVKHGLAQRVAIKLMARHLQSTPAQSQFLLERDALAGLAHRNIAGLVDGGVTPDGIPYLVMEFIEGRRLDVVADEPGTTLRDLAGLMIQLCDAVSYVHRNLMLHRDLKPGNVMVTDEGIVKLLDFGTLKVFGKLEANDAPSAPDSLMTQAGMRPLTLGYASPEHIQASLEKGTAVSTAVDVYSLGMTLYRLLAGRLPATLDLSSATAHLANLAEDSLPAPSATNETLPSSRRQAEPNLAADLDAIALKALRFEAAGRYQGADAMAADLARALADRPVLARAGTMRYRAERFLRRHRTPAAGALAAALVLAAGVGLMVHQGSVARAEVRRAEAGVEKERALAHLLLFDYFDQLKKIPGSTNAQRVAVTQALAYLDSLNRVAAEPRLQMDILQAYTTMGSLQGNGYEENLGDGPGAIQTLEKAIALAKRLLALHPADAAVMTRYAIAEKILGQVYYTLGDPQKAIAHLVPAAELQEKIVAMPGTDAMALAGAASAEDVLGDTYGLPSPGTLNDPAHATTRYEQARTYDLAGLSLDTACASCRRGAAIEDWKLGMAAADNMHAESYYRRGLATVATFSEADQGNTRVRRLDNLLRQNLAQVLIDQGHAVEGMQMIGIVQDRLRAAIAADPVDVRARVDLGILEGNLLNSLNDLKRYQDALPVIRELLADMDALQKINPANTAWQTFRAEYQVRAGHIYQQLGDQQQADRLGRTGTAALVLLADQPKAEARVLWLAADALIWFPVEGGSGPKKAEAFARRAIAASPAPTPEQWLTLAEAQRAAGESAASGKSAESALSALVAGTYSISDAAKRNHANELIRVASNAKPVGASATGSAARR